MQIILFPSLRVLSSGLWSPLGPGVEGPSKSSAGLRRGAEDVNQISLNGSGLTCARLRRDAGWLGCRSSLMSHCWTTGRGLRHCNSLRVLEDADSLRICPRVICEDAACSHRLEGVRDCALECSVNRKILVKCKVNAGVAPLLCIRYRMLTGHDVGHGSCCQRHVN